MAGVKTVPSVVLGFCFLVGLVHGFVVDQPPDSNGWQFSVNGYNAEGNPEPTTQEGTQYTGPTEYHSNEFSTYDAGNPGDNSHQFDANTFPDGTEQFNTDFANSNQFAESTISEEPAQFSSHGSPADASYVYDASAGSNEDSGASSNPDSLFSTDVSGLNTEDSSSQGSYDYTRLSSTQSGTFESASYVLGVPEEREATSLASSDVATEDSPTWAYDARAGNADATSLSSTTVESNPEDQAVPAEGHHGPVSIYTPSSNSDGAFRFYDPRSEENKTINTYVDDAATGAASFAQQTPPSGDTGTSASTAPFLATTGTAPAGIHGCPNLYWAKHVAEWPAQFKITTLVSEAFGKKIEAIYGTTTLFQALLDTREDPYSKLLTHAVAALLNAHSKTGFSTAPKVVVQQFQSALDSKAAAAVQAQKFENENHAYGPNECAV